MGDDMRTPTRHPGRARVATLVGALGLVVMQFQMLLTLPGFSFSTFKRYFASDQLSYLMIAVNVANGHSGSTEPFTETGVSHYPRLYYVLMGLLSRVTDTDPVTMWWVMGLTVQFVLGCFIGWAFVRFTGRWWTGLLAPLPLLIGTFSYFTGGGYYTHLDGHAVLWGPFAPMFALNGGAAGVALGGCAVLALMMSGYRGFPGRSALLVGLPAAVGIGLIGNTQTYAFIGLCYFVLYIMAVYGLQARPDWRLLGISVLLLLAVLAFGSRLSEHIGQLPILVLGLAPALPGYLVVCRLTRWKALWLALVTGAVASPTVLGTALAVRQGDPFLVYREASTANQGNLGVPYAAFLVHGAVAILLLFLIAVSGRQPQARLARAYAAGALTVWCLLSFNDRWGASQEPYRFWIDTFALILITGVPLAAGLAFASLRDRPLRRPARPLLAVVMAVWLVAATVSMADWLLAFNRAARTMGMINWSPAQIAAVTPVMAAVSDSSIVMPSQCIDAYMLKKVTGARVAWFNRGLAWPDRQPQIARAIVLKRAGDRFDPVLAAQAGIGYYVTDSHCRSGRSVPRSLTRVTSRDYVDTQGKAARIVLWKVPSVPS